MSEYKEAWNRIKEYFAFISTRPKSERVELEEDILRSYEQVLINWALEKTRMVRVFVKVSCWIVRILLRLDLL